MDDRVVSPGIDGDGWVASNGGEFGEDLVWQEVFEAVQRPVDRHSPFIAAIIQLYFLLKDGVANAGLLIDID